ncbi:MAG: hypothetical protein WCG20_03150 [bacterium]
MNKFFRNLSLVAFAAVGILLIIMLFPVVLCPMMWMLFVIGLIAQVPWRGHALLIGRMYTVFLFLLVAFRIHMGYVTDFTISTPDSMAVKFLAIAAIYGLGAIILYFETPVFKKYLVYVAFLLSLGAGFFSYQLVQESYYEAYHRFQDNNPDCIALDNFESRDYKEKIEAYYDSINGNKENKYGMVSHTTTTPLHGKNYTFLISNGSAKNTPPIFSIEESDTNNVPIAKIMFRYNTDFNYGFLRCELLNPKDTVILNKDSAQNYIRKQWELVMEISKH